MPQRMWMNSCCDAGITRSFAACEENGFRRDGSAGIVAGEQPAGRSLTSPVVAQQIAQFRRQQSLTILASFAVANPDDVAIAVDVSHLEPSDFAHAESGGVHDREQSAMAKIARRFEQRSHFIAAQAHGQVPIAPCKWNAIDGD